MTKISKRLLLSLLMVAVGGLSACVVESRKSDSMSSAMEQKAMPAEGSMMEHEMDSETEMMKPEPMDKPTM